MANLGYEFRILETPAGEKRYMYTNTNTGKETELSDKAAYDRLKSKFGEATDKAYAEADSGPADLNDFARDTKAKLKNRKASGAAVEGKKKGGAVKSASARADGCAIRGKTRA